MDGSQIFQQDANAQTARHCRQRTTRQLQRETATFQSILCRENPQIRKVSEPLQLDREDLRLVDQVQLKLQRSDLVRDGAVVRLRLGNVVVRIPVLDGPAAAAEVPVSQSLLGLARGEPVQAILAPDSCASRMRASSMVMPRSGRTVCMLNRCRAWRMARACPSICATFSRTAP